MRDLIIRFTNDGNAIKELDRNRNYFFYEANQIVMNLKKQDISFTKGIELEFPKLNLAYQEMLEVDESFPSLKQFVLNVVDSKVNKDTLNTVFYEEGKFFDNKAFCVFVERYDQLLGKKDLKPFPFLISAHELFGLYESAYEVYGHLFYSRLENVVRSMESLFRFIISIPTDASDEKLKKFFFSFIDKETNYIKMKQYVSSYLQSLSVKRIEALYPKNVEYQNTERVLFTELPFYIGFERCHEIHEKMIDTFYLRFHLELFDGNVFGENNHFDELVFRPVITEIYKYIEKELEYAVQVNGYEEELYEIINLYKYGGNVK